MDTHDTTRLALKISADRRTFDGAWWPHSRVLSEELVELFAAWPVEGGYISRVIFSVEDWDDRPDVVDIPNRRGRVKTGILPTDSTHQLVLGMLDGQRRTLIVIPPHIAEETAAKYMRAFDPTAYRVPAGPVAYDPA
jgi:hypothetical protein